MIRGEIYGIAPVKERNSTQYYLTKQSGHPKRNLEYCDRKRIRFALAYEAKPIHQQTTNLEAQAFTKMDSIFEDLNGLFELGETLPDQNNNAEFPVPNLANILKHNITAQEVLEETILSRESIINSIIIDLCTAGLGDLLVDTDEDVVGQNGFRYDAMTSAPTPENHTIPKPISDTTAVVLDVVSESPTSEPAPENHTISLLEDLEKFPESNLEPTCRKRPLEINEESNEPTAPPISKKKRQPSNSSRDVMEHQVSEKSNEEREKNNDACKKSRAKKKANRNKLFELEKEMLEENKVLKSKVEELTKAVTDLKNYLVNRLR